MPYDHAASEDTACERPASEHAALRLVHDSASASALRLLRPPDEALPAPTTRPASRAPLPAFGAVGTALGAQLVEVGWRASDDHHAMVRLAARFAGSSEWSVAGCSSAAQWIGERLDVAVRTAREWIAVGRALRALPNLDEALGQRRLSYAKVRILVRVATPDNEVELIQLACSTTAGSLGASLAAWSRRHEPDDVRDERHRESRSLSWRIEPDGLATGTLRLPADVAGGVRAVIDAAVMRGRRSPPHPTLAQQRADALVAVLCGLGAGGLASGVEPERRQSGGGVMLVAEVVLHVRGDGTTMDDGTPIGDNAVVRALPEAFVRALIHDADGAPVNASGRQRHPTVRQKRVVKARDRCCIDCGGSDLLEYDHVPEHSVSGRTVIEELELRCAVCHRARHERLAATTWPSAVQLSGTSEM